MHSLTPYVNKRNQSLIHSYWMNDLKKDFDILFDYSFSLLFFDENSISVDINDTDKEILVKIDVPGFSLKEISAMLDNNFLRIHGERQEEIKVGNVLRERRYGGFSRSIYSPFANKTNKTCIEIIARY